LIYPQPPLGVPVEKLAAACMAGVVRGIFRKQAARCHELLTLTVDDSAKSFGQRDGFVSITNTQMSSGFRMAGLCYKAFAETKRSAKGGDFEDETRRSGRLAGY
jgi:hypothetical protein